MVEDRMASLVRGAELLFSSDRPLNELLDGTRELLARYLDASIVLAFIERDGALHCEYASIAGAAGAPDHELVIPADSNTMKAFTASEPILLSRRRDWKVQSLASIRGFSRSPASAIFVPIVSGRPLGVLSVQSGSEDVYRRDDVALLQICAKHIGAKIAGDGFV